MLHSSRLDALRFCNGPCAFATPPADPWGSVLPQTPSEYHDRPGVPDMSRFPFALEPAGTHRGSRVGVIFRTLVTRTIRLAWLLVFLLASACAARASWQGVDRVVAIGDVHGDYDGLVTLLRQAELVDASDTWSGGQSHLVQLGTRLALPLGDTPVRPYLEKAAALDPSPSPLLKALEPNDRSVPTPTESPQDSR